MHGLAVYVKEGLPFAQVLSLENSADTYFTQCLTCFSFIDQLLCLCARFFILFHLRQIRFSPSTLLIMCLSLETLTFIIRTGIPILVELIDLVNSVIISNDLRWLTFLFASQPVVFTVLLFWIFSSDASLCSAVVSLQWEILIMLLSQFPLTFHHINNVMPRFIALLMTILVIIGTVYVII